MAPLILLVLFILIIVIVNLPKKSHKKKQRKARTWFNIEPSDNDDGFKDKLHRKMYYWWNGTPEVQELNRKNAIKMEQEKKRKEEEARRRAKKQEEAHKRYLEKEAERRKKLDEFYDRYVNDRDSLRNDGKHIYVHAYGDDSKIIISLQQERIGVFNYKKKFIHEYMVTDFDSITKIQMIERSDMQNTRNNSLAGAALGTVVAGGVGAIAGAVSGGSHNYNHIREISIRIFYKNQDGTDSIKFVIHGATSDKSIIRESYKRFDQLDDFFQEQQFNVEYIR